MVDSRARHGHSQLTGRVPCPNHLTARARWSREWGLSERATIEPPTRGEAAERLVVERVRAVVDPGVLVLDNVQWLLRERGTVRNGEADIVIGDPERGILVIEVKAARSGATPAGRGGPGRTSSLEAPSTRRATTDTPSSRNSASFPTGRLTSSRSAGMPSHSPASISTPCGASWDCSGSMPTVNSSPTSRCSWTATRAAPSSEPSSTAPSRRGDSTARSARRGRPPSTCSRAVGSEPFENQVDVCDTNSSRARPTSFD